MHLHLQTRGSQLAVRNGSFWVRTPELEQFVPFHVVKCVQLHPATKITHEAVLKALEHDIDLLFVDAKGFPAGRVWGHRFGSVSTIRKNQLLFAASAEGREWVRRGLLRKADHQLSLLLWLGQATGRAADLTEAADTLRRLADKLRHHADPEPSGLFASFRGFEGSLSRAYFGAIGRVLPERYRFERRSQHPATDAFNCLLNYAYGMLYGLVESALIRAGLDPALGVMHRDEYNRPVFTYDFIEPYRGWADYVVCHLCVQEVIFDEFFDRPSTGAWWLNASGKRILVQSFNDYLGEVVSLGGLSRSRQTHLDLDAQRMATQLKKYT